jgi:excisionase family DNA binding protein
VARSQPRLASPSLDDGPYIDKSEFAKLLNVSMRSVERGLARGELPKPIRIGRLLRWRRSAVTEYLKRLEEQAQS